MSAVWVALVEVIVACALAAFLAARQARRQTARHDRLAMVVDLLAEVLGDDDDERAASGMMARLAGLMGADTGCLGIPVGDRLLLVGSYGLTGPGRSLRAGEGLAGRCWVQGRPLVKGVLTGDPDYVEGGSSARSGIYVPARSEGRVTAVLALESHRENAFSTRDLRVLQPVADLVGSVVASRRRASTAEDLERRLLPMVSAATAAPLRRLEASLDELLSPLSDEDGAERSRSAALTAATLAARELDDVVGSLTSSVEDFPLDARPVEVSELLAQVLRAAERRGLTGVGLDADLTAPVEVDASLLVPALTAVLLTRHGCEPVRARRVGPDVVLTLPGDPSALPSHVCRRLVERMGGLLTPGLRPGAVVLTLPVARERPAPGSPAVPVPVGAPRHRLLRLTDPVEVH